MNDKQIKIDAELVLELMIFARLLRYQLQRLQQNVELQVYRGARSWIQDLQQEIERIERVLDVVQEQTGLNIPV